VPAARADGLTFKIGDEQLENDEQGYDIRSIRKISKPADSAYRLRLVCRIGSEAHADEMVLALVAKSPLHGEMLVRFDQANGIVRTYRRCP